jgi:hypothetical protein
MQERGRENVAIIPNIADGVQEVCIIDTRDNKIAFTALPDSLKRISFPELHKPKSAIFARPSVPTSTFRLLRLRCTT